MARLRNIVLIDNEADIKKHDIWIKLNERNDIVNERPDVLSGSSITNSSVIIESYDDEEWSSEDEDAAMLRRYDNQHVEYSFVSE